MTAWPKDQLKKIAEADDSHISLFREEGVTYGTPTGSGQSLWTMASMCAATTARNRAGIKPRQKAGRIAAAGVTKEVTFEPVTVAINDRIDDAYREKYRTSPYLDPMISARARAATVKIMPRGK